MIENPHNKVVYENIATNVFQFPYRFFEPADIQCFLEHHGAESTLVNGTDFTVNTADDYSYGGAITLRMDPLPAGGRLTIMRVLPPVQQLALPEHGILNSRALETQLDKIVMFCQQLQELSDRSIKWSPGADPDAPPRELLIAAVEAAAIASRELAAVRTLVGEVRTMVTNLRDETTAELASAREETAALLNSAAILDKDTTLTFTAGGGSEEDSHAAWVANQATLDALPRNLGGHTLQVKLNYQKLPSEAYGGSPNLFFSFDGFYNGHIEISGEIEAYGDASDDRYNEFIRVVNCHCPVLFDRVDFPNAGVHVAVTAKNSTGLTFSNCTFRGYYDPEDVEFWSNAGAAVVLTNSDADFTGENTLTDSGSTLLRIADGRDGYFAAAALEQRVAALEAIHTN